MPERTNSTSTSGYDRAIADLADAARGAREALERGGQTVTITDPELSRD